MLPFIANHQRRRRNKNKSNALYKPKVEFTEDGFVVTTLYLRPLKKEITREDLLNYFSSFGEVGNVRIHKKSSCLFGFVTFVKPESAAKALVQSVHSICRYQLVVTAADSWHQAKPLAVSNNDHEGASQSTSVVKMPIELPNATGTTFMDLNDDCLYEIFSLKFLNIMDLCSVAECNKRLKQIANRVFTGSYKICKFKQLSLKTIHEIRRFLINFGSLIKEFEIGPSYEMGTLSIRTLDFVTKYCSKTLESLTLDEYEINEYLVLKLKPMFSRLKKIHIKGGSIGGAVKTLFANCASLVELKVIELVNYTEGARMIFGNRFPKLERFKFVNDYDLEYEDYDLKSFISSHKSLKAFGLKNFNEDCAPLLPVIANSCKTLEKLQIEGEYIHPSEFVEALSSLLTLTKLNKLKIDCGTTNVTTFIRELPKLNCLKLLELRNAKGDAEFVQALCELKHLNVLRLVYCEGFTDLNPISCMEQLNELTVRLRDLPEKNNLDLVKMVKRLINLKKLVLEFSGTLKIDKRMYLSIVDAVRGRPHRLPSFLEITSDAFESDVAGLQFDGNNIQTVKLCDIEDSDPDFDASFYSDDDEYDNDYPHQAFLMPLFNWFHENFTDSDEDDSDTDIVW